MEQQQAPRRTAETISSYRATAKQVAEATASGANGVIVDVRSSSSGADFCIWTINPQGALSRHYLDAECTSAERLTQHVAGFIANHRAEFARAALSRTTEGQS